MSSLMDRLKALGVSVGTSEIEQPTKPKSNIDLAEALGGEYCKTIYGNVIRIIKTFPIGFKHGEIFCTHPQTHEVFRAWGNLPDFQAAKDFLFLDTETSGLSSGTGTFAFLVGMGYFTDDNFKLIQYFLESPANEPAMLAQFIQDISDTNIFVTYNGKSFDIPLLRNRLILNRIENPLDEYAHADLLHITRKLYKLYLPERNLGVVEKEILRLKRDDLEVPGWMVPEIYTQFLQNLDPEPIKRVLYHNEIDIVSLAALYQHINTLLGSFSNNQAEKIPYLVRLSMIRLFIENQQIEAAQLILDELPVEPKHVEEYAKTAFLMGMVFKQQNNPSKAIGYWQQAAQYDNIYACVELAKYYEHTAKSYQQALDFTLQAQKQANKHIPINNLLLDELTKRYARLIRLIPVE